MQCFIVTFTFLVTKIYGAAIDINSDRVDFSRYLGHDYMQETDPIKLVDALKFFAFMPLLMRFDDPSAINEHECDMPVYDLIEKITIYFNKLQECDNLDTEDLWDRIKTEVQTNIQNIYKKILNQNMIEKNNDLKETLEDLIREYEININKSDLSINEFFKFSKDILLIIMKEINTAKINNIKHKENTNSDNNKNDTNPIKNIKLDLPYHIHQHGCRNHLYVCAHLSKDEAQLQLNDNNETSKNQKNTVDINLKLSIILKNKTDLNVEVEDIVNDIEDNSVVDDITNKIDNKTAEEIINDVKKNEIVKDINDLLGSKRTDEATNDNQELKVTDEP